MQAAGFVTLTGILVFSIYGDALTQRVFNDGFLYIYLIQFLVLGILGMLNIRGFTQQLIGVFMLHSIYLILSCRPYTR